MDSHSETKANQQRSQIGIIIILLLAATLIAYWPVFHNGFINYDDPDYVTANPRVQAGLNSSNLAWAFFSFHICNWHPLTWLSHMLDVELFGSNPAGPHAINLLLHGTNAALLFVLLFRMTGAQWKSAVVAGLFALHPTHVESVAWISERKDVISTFFGMLTLLAYERYTAEKRSGRVRWMFYVLTMVCFALGLMSKPMLVTLPGVMWLLDLWPLQRWEKTSSAEKKSKTLLLIVEKFPFVVLSAASCVLTSMAQQEAMQHLENYPFSARIANAFISYVRYVGKTFWPSNLQLPYLRTEPWHVQAVIAAATVVILISLTAILLRRKFPYLFTGWFWFMGTLVPVIGLVQVGIQMIADRYTYIPQIGLSIAVVWSVSELVVKYKLPRSAIAPGVAVILITCALLTQRQAGYWRDSETLFEHAAAISPDNYVAWSNIGGELFKKGDLDKAMENYQRAYHINPRFPDAVNSIGAILDSKENPGAEDWFRKALELDPYHADAAFNLGNCLAKQGKTAEAIEIFQKALALRPENYEARNNLANALFKLGRLDEATSQYELALRETDSPLIHKNLGEALAAKGRLDEAMHQYRLALAHTNDAAVHYSLGLTLAVKERWSEAIEHYHAALDLAPTNAAAEYNLGYAYRVTGKLPLAEKHLNEALKLEPEFPLAYYNLGCVLAVEGKVEDAKVQLNRALQLKPDYIEASRKLRELESMGPRQK